MKNKQFIITILLMLVTSIAFSQERVNRQKINFDTTSSIITKATGWAYNEALGEWIDYENIISEDKSYKDKYKSLQGRYMMSNEYQSFISLQVKKITFNNAEYYVLIINQWGGNYEYPSIRQNWYEYNETFGFIYNKEEYKKLLSLDSLIEIKTQHRVRMGSKYEKYDEVVFLDLIQTELLKEKMAYNDSYSSFSVMKTKENFIRFHIPISTSSYFKDKWDFTKGYFETDFNNFSKIILNN